MLEGPLGAETSPHAHVHPGHMYKHRPKHNFVNTMARRGAPPVQLNAGYSRKGQHGAGFKADRRSQSVGSKLKERLRTRRKKKRSKPQKRALVSRMPVGELNHDPSFRTRFQRGKRLEELGDPRPQREERGQTREERQGPSPKTCSHWSRISLRRE